MTAGFPTYHVMGIRPDGQGNITDTHVAWHVETARCYVPSPVVIGDYLYIADDRGTLEGPFDLGQPGAVAPTDAHSGIEREACVVPAEHVAGVIGIE